MTRYVVRCDRCHGAWIEDVEPGHAGNDHHYLAANLDGNDHHHADRFWLYIDRVEYNPDVRSCREGEPGSEIGVGLRYARPGECGLHCRGSVSPECACPVCKGEHHGELRLQGASPPGELEGLYAKLEDSAPRPDADEKRRRR